MNLNFNRATRARIHTALLDAMPGENPAAEQAFAEAVAWAGSSGVNDLAMILDLSVRIDFHVYRAIHCSDFEYAEVDASALGELYTAGTVNLAMRIAGYGPRVSGCTVLWTDAPGNELSVKVTLKAKEFEND